MGRETGANSQAAGRNFRDKPLIFMRRKLLIATGNAHKVREFREMLGADFDVLDLSAVPSLPPPEEPGVTFEENAAIKAIYFSKYIDSFVLADDSGLEVDALGGAPGVRSARYAGDGSNADSKANSPDAANRAKLLAELECAGASEENRSARFRCAIALAKNGELLSTFDGAVEGKIIGRERGEGGFGYDSLFVPDGFDETFSELPAAVKNSLSHRGRALAKAVDFLFKRCA
jgi:XTP/dITP diphosphohydrolase